MCVVALTRGSNSRHGDGLDDGGGAWFGGGGGRHAADPQDGGLGASYPCLAGGDDCGGFPVRGRHQL